MNEIPSAVVSSININALPKGTFSLTGAKKHNFLLYFISPGQSMAMQQQQRRRKERKKIVERFINELLVMKYRPLTIANHFEREQINWKKNLFSCCIKKNCRKKLLSNAMQERRAKYKKKITKQ